MQFNFIPQDILRIQVLLGVQNILIISEMVDMHINNLKTNKAPVGVVGIYIY